MFREVRTIYFEATRSQNYIFREVKAIYSFKREVRTIYLNDSGGKRGVKAIHFFAFVKSELHIESHKGNLKS